MPNALRCAKGRRGPQRTHARESETVGGHPTCIGQLRLNCGFLALMCSLSNFQKLHASAGTNKPAATIAVGFL